MFALLFPHSGRRFNRRCGLSSTLMLSGVILSACPFFWCKIDIPRTLVGNYYWEYFRSDFVALRSISHARIFWICTPWCLKRVIVFISSVYFCFSSFACGFSVLTPFLLARQFTKENCNQIYVATRSTIDSGRWAPGFFLKPLSGRFERNMVYVNYA